MQGLGTTVVLVLLASGCAAPGDRARPREAPILGGTEASVGDYPTVVAVLNEGLCTGTLVAPDRVLTAAHCISAEVLGYASQAEVTADTTVIVDAADLYVASGRAIAAADTVPHPGFDIDALGEHDIGVIELATPVTDRDPSPINRVHADAPVGISTTLIGYGMTNPWIELSYGRLFVLADEVSVACDPALGSDTHLLCFDQSDGTGSCSGDSGGPAFADIGGVPMVVGVTSFGDQHCLEHGAYTRIDAELSFLDAHLPPPGCADDGECAAACRGDGLSDDPDCPSCTLDGACEPACGTDGLPVDPDCAVCGAGEDCGDAVAPCESGSCVVDDDAGSGDGGVSHDPRGRGCEVSPPGAPAGGLPVVLLLVLLLAPARHAWRPATYSRRR